MKKSSTNPVRVSSALLFACRAGGSICFRALRSLVAISLASLLLGGCAIDVANRYYSTRTYPPKPPEQVQILRKTPARAYEVIADFQSKWDSPEGVRAKAAKIGADAVIISTPGGQYRTDQQWAGQDSYAGSSERICGTAIVFK